ncbi:pilus assembly protein PilM [Coraliomargarita sp. SDUM461004]|uniref:Pilus assembly protein PilM n=1 Tax=Thalassobacterium sedimentorum TaxID=3041258 RepID=A0ABU1AJS5_9BACT|nr:pilus assembly protein PilM [Coraliomargarita sp. SDUM461004]MDQ8194418.1 pilus assembly protein PilM [Coraliomargarita sp. SDUM461004]
MSSSKQLIINCGASRVTAAVVSSGGGTLQIEKLVTESLQYDYSNDDAWLDAVGLALRDLHGKHKFSGKASFIIPGNQVLTKTIRIPHVEDSKRAQIIAFEAQQNIPYPLHEVVWDSQVVGDDGVETEVLFIACKSNTIDDFCREVSQAGFTAETINAATVLDYNAIQFAYPSLDEDVLLINIGARSTNLLFKNSEGFFVRNIQLGGNSLTQNIADSLGKPFAQAEEVKHKFFNAGMDYSQDDSGAKLLSSCSDSFMRRMSQEITRSIVNYRRQKGGAAPKRILLSGRGALLEGLSEQLATTQKVAVEFFDPLQNVTLDGDIGSDSNSLRLEISEIIGAAAQDLVADSAGVNLLPDEVQREMQFASKKPFLMVAAICLALAPWPAFIGYKQLSAGYTKAAEATTAQVAPLQSRQAQIAKNAQRAAEISESISRVEGLVNSKSNWIQFFAELQESLTTAEDAWLDSLKVNREKPSQGPASYEVVVEGQMLVRETANGNGDIDQAVLSRRIKSLQDSFESSEFIVSSKPPKINWSSLHNGLNVLPFTINLVVDTAKPL